MTAPILNLADIELVPRPPEYAPTGAAAAAFDASTARVSGRLGARKLGYNVTAVAPGKAAYPYHCHRINEEMFLVLQGHGEVRIGDRRFPIRPGDIVACPAGGPETAHQIVNTGTAPLHYLAVSTAITPEVCEYPDSGKFGVYATFESRDGTSQDFYFMGRESQLLDYWDGEGPAGSTA